METQHREMLVSSMLLKNSSLNANDNNYTYGKALPVSSDSNFLKLIDSAQHSVVEVQCLWAVSVLCLMELFLLWIQGKPLPPAHENLMSIAQSIFYTLGKILVRSFEMGAYIWVWKNYGFCSQYFSDSPLTFICCAIFIDFGYYWFHRISHEVMVFWAIHQVHHMSMDQTVSVGLRHSPLQSLFQWIFFLPFAVLGMPPSHLLVHLQFNLMFQTWIHTNVVDTLGPLEYILNTPSHHRVHHGSTAYCLDTNYGGIFIIWDRIFGTFQKELQDVEIVYGILYPPDTWNVLTNQIHYYGHTISKARSMKNWKNFFDTFWKGPSWQPGSSRTGRELNSFYENQPTHRPLSYAAPLVDIYVMVHLIGALLMMNELITLVSTEVISRWICILTIMAAITNVGIIYEGKTIVPRLEFWRCLLGLSWFVFGSPKSDQYQYFQIVLYTASLIIWFSPQRLHSWFLGKGNTLPARKVD